MTIAADVVSPSIPPTAPEGGQPVKKRKKTKPQQAETITDTDQEAMFEAPAEALSQQIAANMCGVDVVVKRISGSIKIPGVKVLAVSKEGKNREVKKTTKPGFIYDDKTDHALWYQIDENARRIEATVEKFSINDARRGFHLVPMSKTGNLLLELRRLRRERLELVEQLKDPANWKIWKANLKEKYPDHYHTLEPRLPDPELLLEKHDVNWTLNPLTPINPKALKFNDMNDDDREAIIKESNQMAQELVRQRASAIFNLVFQPLLDQCDAIAKGALETGVRKFGGIEELVFQLEKLKNFSDFGNDDICEHANNTLAILRNINDIEQVNMNQGRNAVTKAVKEAMKPLASAIRSMYDSAKPDSGTSRRSLE